MIWQQGVVCFLVWMGYGVWLRTRSDRLRARIGSMNRTQKVAYASVGLIGSAVLLLACFAGITAAGGISEGSLRPWAWASTMIAGLVFVHLQVMGAGAMILIVQDQGTRSRGQTSDVQDTLKESQQ